MNGVRRLPLVLVHGGAWDIPPPFRAHTVDGCRTAAEAGYAALRAGADAEGAAVAAVHVLEDWPSLGAGVGSMRDLNGDIALDASIMRGADLGVGAVGNVPPTRHPIDLARAVMRDGAQVLMVGRAALEWGSPRGVAPCALEALLAPPPYDVLQRDRPDGSGHDTVGAVVVDGAGRVVVATSTGGTPGRHPGRVGDAPCIGCGTYADDAVGGAGATGTGEVIIRTTLARSVLFAVEQGAHPAEAAREAVESTRARTGGTAGVIVADVRGRVGAHHTTPAMCWALRDDSGTYGDWRGRSDLRS